MACRRVSTVVPMSSSLEEDVDDFEESNDNFFLDDSDGVSGEESSGRGVGRCGGELGSDHAGAGRCVWACCAESFSTDRERFHSAHPVDVFLPTAPVPGNSNSWNTTSLDFTGRFNPKSHSSQPSPSGRL